MTQKSFRKGKQKSDGKEKQKLSEDGAEVGKKKKFMVTNYKRVVEKGKAIMVEDVGDVKKKKVGSTKSYWYCH
ncbi:hypothetical protein Tco_0074875 [Tanacetum coccineum]